MLAALLLLALQDGPAASTRSFDRIVELELSAQDPVLEGHGPSKRVEHTIEFTGSLHIWVKVDGDLDTCLRVEDGEGKLLAEDDDSGGKPAPYVKLEVEPGQKIVIAAAASKTGVTGKLELHVVAAPETEATRKSAAEALASVSKAKALAQRKQFKEAQTEITDAVRTLEATDGIHASVAAIQALSALGGEAWKLGVLEPSETARRSVVADLEHLLSPDHPVLQYARWYLVWTLRDRGLLAEARDLSLKVLDARTRTLPEDHPDVQTAMSSLAWTLRLTGELQRAKELEEKVLASAVRRLGEDHLETQWARAGLASTLVALGDMAHARELDEKVLAIRERALPSDHPDVILARANLAWSVGRMGDLERAKALQENVLEVRSRTLPEDHFDLQAARANLAATVLQLGEVKRARELQERVLEISSRTLAPGHPDLNAARNNLALTLRCQGDLVRARMLLEQTVATDEDRQPNDTPVHLRGLANLAETMRFMGDAQGARALLERVIALQEKTLPEENRDFTGAISALARVEIDAGRPERAIDLIQRLIAVQLRHLPADHPDLILSKAMLGHAIFEMGDSEGARVVFQEVLDATTRVYPADSPSQLWGRLDLGAALQRLGRLDEARALFEQILAAEGKSVSRGADMIRAARHNLLLGGLRRGDRTQAEEQCLQLARGVCVTIERATLTLAPREAEGVTHNQSTRISSVLYVALSATTSPRASELSREAFTLAETARGVGLASRHALRSAEKTGELGARESKLRREIQEAAQELADSATSGAGSAKDFQSTLRRKDAAERALVEAIGASGAVDWRGRRPDPAAIAARLGRSEVAVGFWVYTGPELEPEASHKPERMNRILALVLSADGAVRWVDLGARDRITAAVERWRNALLAPIPRGTPIEPGTSRAEEERAAGTEVLQAVIAPVRAVCPDATRWSVALDDVLHLVPIDALPDATGVVGDHLQIVVLPILSDLLSDATSLSGPPTLVAMGGIEFDREPATAVAAAPTSASAARPRAADSDRSGLWERGFAPLPETAQEVRAIEALFRKTFPDAEAVQRLEDREASKPSLIALAPRARFLHLATHGYFAPESIVSLTDEPTTSKWLGSGVFSFADQVKGLSPWLLCGLALAGANQPPDSTGRLAGVITAEEVSAIDLSHCELAVLSACDTNVGVRRAGLGIASLQAALHAAGARSVITSLWKVPDEATKDLMIDFYRRLWVEKKPKHQALWEAKLKIRNAKDENGKPKYSTRDWAAWVLTGDPR